MAVSQQTCSHCGRKQYVGEDIESFRCQLCGSITYIEDASDSRDWSTANAENIPLQHDYEYEISEFKKLTMKKRSEAVSSFWKGNDVWVGIDNVDWLSRESVESFVSKVLIRSTDLDKSKANVIIGTTFLEFKQVERKRGPFGLFGKEADEFELTDQIRTAKLLCDQIIGNIMYASQDRLKGSIEFSNEPKTSRVTMSGAEISKIDDRFCNTNHIANDQSYCILPVSINLTIEFGVDEDPIPNWRRFSWPRIESLRLELKDMVDMLKKSSLIRYIADTTAPHYPGGKLRPKNERRGIVLGTERFQEIGKMGKGSNYSRCFEETYQDSVFNELSLEQIMALAFALEETTRFYIPYENIDHYVQYKCDSPIDEYALFDSFFGLEGILLLDASSPFPKKDRSLFDAISQEEI